MFISDKEIAQRIKELEKEKKVKEIASELGLTIMDVHNILKRETVSERQALKLGYRKVIRYVPIKVKI